MFTCFVNPNVHIYIYIQLINITVVPYVDKTMESDPWICGFGVPQNK